MLKLARRVRRQRFTEFKGQLIRRRQLQIDRFPPDVDAEEGTVGDVTRRGRRLHVTVLTDDGEVVIADVPTGDGMASLADPGGTVFVSPRPKSVRLPGLFAGRTGLHVVGKVVVG